MLTLSLAIISSIALLLFLIIKLRINAFLSLLVASIWIGITAGMPITEISGAVIEGMGKTLGFVATIVGLGAIFGAILEHSGGAKSLALFLVKKFGEKQAPLAMVVTGFVVAIPVFFDVAFIILIPIIYALSQRTKKSLLIYAIPLLSGLVITHSFIPPTPGPIAVADIIGADLGWVILLGLIVGLPTALIGGLVFGKYIGEKIYVGVPEGILVDESPEENHEGLIGWIFGIIALPILLILGSTVSQALIKSNHLTASSSTNFIQFIGHPIISLILATFIALYFLGTRRGMTKEQLSDISMKALAPAGAIILITGAGGVYKQMLSNTGAGEMIGTALAQVSSSYLFLAFAIAALVRIAQGSATVAMITAAGIVAPLMESVSMGMPQKALLVLAIAAGATTLSHVNDSGFWLVSRYLGLSEQNTFKSWTALTTLISFCSLTIIFLLYLVV